jgi:ketosteroid isomerase-like protein
MIAKAAVLLLLVAAASGASAQVVFGKPVNLGAPLNSGGADGSPSLTADGLELYFNSNKPGGQGGLDLWVATRDAASKPWGSPVNLGPVVNTAGFEVAPTVSSDGLELIFSDYGKPRAGGQGKTDLWVTKRASRTAPWGKPENLGPLVNSAEDEITPVISPSGLELFIDSYRPGGLGYSDLWVSRRATKAAAWGAPEWLGPAINGPGIEHCPTLSPDGLTMFFDRTPPNRAKEIGDLMITRRASLSSPWGPAMDLGHAQSTHWAACVSADGKSLIYVSDAPGGVGAMDLWEVSFSYDPKAAAMWQTVTGIFDDYIAACRALDAKAFVALWDEQGVKYMPGFDPIEGRQAIEALLAAYFSRCESEDVSIMIESVHPVGSDRILARGICRRLDRIKGEAAMAALDAWFVTEFLKQADGSWKICLDAVGNLPAKAAK